MTATAIETSIRKSVAAGRETELRAALAAILAGTPTPRTRKELWDALPDALRVNEVKFEEVLEAGVGACWRREKMPGRAGGFAYRPLGAGKES